jgi:TP901 family phage tail tape measure protein
MELEAQAIKFRRVYGDMFTTTDQTNKALEDVRLLAEEFTKYGVAVSKTMEMAAEAAAMGKTGSDLQAQVAEATRLAILGGVEQTDALQTTISITNAFGVAAEDLSKKIDFLNAVENQTVVSIEDLTIAIPKAGPVVKQLGGDVEDLAFFLTAMKEGGINASQGANALKSGLASLINPTAKASEMLQGFGININSIVEGNQGNIRQTVIDFARALDTLAPLDRARAIEQLFGKFQFARLSTLFKNVTTDGTQASKVLDLAGSSIEQLAILSERELKTVEDAIGINFKASVQELKLAIAPIGETFLQAVTPIVKIIGNLLDKFNNLGDGTKKFIVIATTLVGVIGPVLLMTFGLLANGTANIIKLFLALRVGFLKLGGNSKILAEQTNYMNAEQMESATVAASLNQAHTRLTQSFTAETSAVRLLRQAYVEATVAAANFARANPGMMMPGRKGAAPKKFAKGSPYVPGTGTGDIVPSLLTPGEAVIPKDIAQDPRFQPIIEAMVNGNLQGFDAGSTGVGFDGREFNARTAQSKKSIKSFLDELIKNPDGTLTYIDSKDTSRSGTFTKARLSEILEKYSSRGELRLTDVKRSLMVGSGFRGRQSGSSKPPWIDTLQKEAMNKDKTIFAENSAIEKRLKAEGIQLTQRQRKDIMGVDASHVKKEFDSEGRKVWKASNIAPEPGYINKYLNNQVSGKDLARNLLKMTDVELANLKLKDGSPIPINKKELQKLYDGNHASNSSSAATLRSIARYQIEKFPGNKKAIYNAIAVDEGIKHRLDRNYYKGGLKTLAQRLPGSKEVRQERAKASGTKSGVVTGQTGKAKPARVLTTSGAPSEKRTISLGKGEAVLNEKSTGALRRGAAAFIPGLGRLRIAGAEQGIPTGQQTGSTTLGAVSQKAQLRQSQLLAAAEGSSLKQAKRKLAAEVKLTKSIQQSTEAMNSGTETQKTTKQKLQQFSGKAGMAIGAVSGLTIAASFAGGKVGEMAQALMPFVFGLQGIVMLLPLLANPWVAAIAAIALVGGVMFKMAKDMENARKEGINLANAMSMTSKKIVDLSVISGTVSATESANRRRENALSGASEAKRQFGQNVLESEIGKQMSKDMSTQLVSGKSEKEVARNFANQLAVAVTQGAITTEQARSIAVALGDRLGDYEIPALISGQLVRILGPDGQNLESDPINVLLNVQKSSMADVQAAFDDAITGANVNAIKGSMPTWQKILDSLPNIFGQVNSISKTVAKQQTEALKSQAIQTGINAVSQGQGQLDIANQYYDTKLKTAKTEDEIKKIEIDRKDALDQLNDKNAANLKTIINLKDQISTSAFDKTIKTAIDNLYKDADENTKKLVNNALSGLKQIKNLDLRTTLQIGMASGTVKEGAARKIIEYATSNKDFSTNLKLLIDSQGTDEAMSIISLLGRTKASAETVDLFIKYAIENEEDFSTVFSSITALSKMQETYGFQFDLNTNGQEKLQAGVDAVKQIQGLEDELTFDIVKGLAEKNPGEWGEFYAQWDNLTLQGKNQTVNRTVKIAFDAASQDKPLLDRIRAGSKNEDTLGEILGLGGGIAGVVPPKVELREDTADPKTRDTTLDDILNRLKMVREQSIKATGGVKELLRITGGKGLTQFGGVMQDLLKKNPGGINREFLDFIDSMDDKTRKIYLTEKNGIAVLTGKGKALKEAYDEAIIGEYQYSQQESLDAAKGQLAALQKLKAAGVPTAQAVEMVADAALAVAINGKDITSEELVKMGRRAKKAADELERVGVALSMSTAAGRIDIVQGEASKANDYFDKQAALIELQREGTSVYKGYNSTIEDQNVIIEEATDKIDGYQKAINTAQRKLEMDTEFGSRVIDNLNSQVDALNRTAEINFDRPLENLSDESNILSNTLGLIDKAEEGINKKYDAQQEALSKISQLNSDIAAQEKQRLTLADALSQGDISAAAAAAQDMRTAAAEAASRRSSGVLTAAREAEIDAVSVSGMTRTQIQERQFQIGQQTFALEQQRQVVEAQILSIQDQIYAKEQLRLPLIAQIRTNQDLIYDIQTEELIPAQELLDTTTKKRDAYIKMTGELISQLDYLGRTKKSWEDITTELVAAQSSSDKIKNESSESAKAAKEIFDNWTKTKPLFDDSVTPASTLKDITSATAIQGAALLASWKALNKTFTTTHIINTIYTSTGSGGGGGSTSQFNPYGGKIMPMNYGGMVPKYMAMGGAVGSDTVPAMLTPGEFVMNKAATKRFGPMLNQMNNSKFPSMIEDMTPAVYSSNNSSIVAPTITSVATTVADNSSTMYNYNIGINVPQSNASSNDIARAVIGQIKYIDSQRIRGQK